MRVLVACERSGVVRDAFLARGHDAWSCDVLPGRGERHIQKDALGVMAEPWDLVIAHPPCTYLSKMGAARRAEDFGRRIEMVEACKFFLACWNANAPRVCVENPIMFLEARRRIGIEPTQLVCPSMFGAGITKATYLWLRGLPLLVPDRPRQKPSGGEPGKRGFIYRSKGFVRSVLHARLAEAMATQWG